MADPDRLLALFRQRAALSQSRTGTARTAALEDAVGYAVQLDAALANGEGLPRDWAGPRL